MADGVLTQLAIQHIRNIAQAEIRPAASLNLITGANAAGKTSILEAIYYLSRAKSFRTHHLKRILQTGQSKLAIYGRVYEHNQEWPLGLEKTESSQIIRIRQQNINSLAELSRSLPVQLIQPGSQRLLEDGPAARRKYLDWGVFHVEPEFHQCWRRYYRALKQRNAALRTGQQDIAVALEPELLAWGQKMHDFRQLYIQQLQTQLDPFIRQLFTDTDIEIRYRPGWLATLELAGALQEKRSRDLETGTTSSGPHRANLEFMISGTPAESYLSRGQLKMFVICLILAQMQHFQHSQQKACILLIDDLAAELDQQNQRLLLDWVRQMGCQTFITTIQAEPLILEALVQADGKRFHVEHGIVKEVVQ